MYTTRILDSSKLHVNVHECARDREHVHSTTHPREIGCSMARVRANQSQECGGRPSGCREGEVMCASSCSASEVASVAVSACASRRRAFSSWRSTGGMPLMPPPAWPSETKEGSRPVWVGAHHACAGCRADGAALRSEHARGTLPIHHPYPRRRSRSRSAPGPERERAASGVAAAASARASPQRG